MLGWEIIIFDPAQITYMSESIPAYCIIYLNICGWIWFSRCSWVTVKKYPLKKRFYIFMNIFSTFWFWSGPIVLIIANFILDNWVREEVVQSVDSAIITAGFIFFLTLTCPFCKAKHFPYHIRTNQIANQQNNFPNNVYEIGAVQNGTTNNCA
uniref:GPR180/TMEM145 transmembrane domain-containing protein n=1 Tax=Meloidogyne incognita TaxID=6306 RepID=A0A914MDD1_MELIC